MLVFFYMEEEVRNYEITFLVSSTLEEKEARDLFEKIKEEAKKDSGIIVKEEEPKLIALSYSIKKENRAYLAVLEFRLTGSKLAEFKEKVEKESKLLRYLIIKKKERKEKKEKPVKPGKEEKEKRLEKKEKPSEEKKKTDLKNIEEKIEEITK